jgi:hypothetical protein
VRAAVATLDTRRKLRVNVRKHGDQIGRSDYGHLINGHALKVIPESLALIIFYRPEIIDAVGARDRGALFDAAGAGTAVPLATGDAA